MDSDEEWFLGIWLILSAVFAILAWYFSVSFPFDYGDAIMLSVTAIGCFLVPPLPFYVYKHFLGLDIDEIQQIWATIIAALSVVTAFVVFLPFFVSSYILPLSFVTEALSVLGASLAVTIVLPFTWLALSSLCEGFNAFLRYWTPTSGVLLILSLLLWLFPWFLPAYLPSSELSLALSVSVSIIAGWVALPPPSYTMRRHEPE